MGIRWWKDRNVGRITFQPISSNFPRVTKYAWSRYYRGVKQFLYDLLMSFFSSLQLVLRVVDLNMWINCLFPWKQLKVHIFVIPPNSQRDLFLMKLSFGCCLCWFRMLGPKSFSNDVTISSHFFRTGDDSFQEKIIFIALMMHVSNMDSLFQINIFPFMRNPNIKIINESKII